MIKVGDAEIRRVEELSIPNPIAYVTRDEALITENRHWLSPQFLDANGRWKLTFQSWLLCTDGKVVLIDPCTGNGRPNLIHHPFHMLNTRYMERFCATGIRPEDVNYVFCTHLHYDHCGWNTQLCDGRYVATFPNARYIFVRREYERWDPKRPDHRLLDYNEGTFERSVLPIIEAGVAELVDDRHRLLPSLSIEPAPGHTTAHSMLHLVSKGEEAYFTADIFHHPLQLVRPEIQFGDADDLEQAIETRRRVVNLCLERDALIIPAHLPTPHAGKVRRQNDAVSFEALANDTSHSP